MMRIRLSLVIVTILYLTLIDATNVRNCLGENKESLVEVALSACEGAPCIIKKNTTVHVQIKFIPDHEVTWLEHSVYAVIGGVNMPFIGVDGTPACDYVRLENSASEQGCPLIAGALYVYNHQFDVLPAYPQITLKVHWALEDVELQRDVVCFEIQARIVN